MNRKLFNAQLTQYATPTVTGEGSVTLEDNIRCYLPYAKIEGDTYQEAYNGINLYDISKVNGANLVTTTTPDVAGSTSYGTITDGVLHLKYGMYANGTLWTGAKIPITKGGNYYISCDVLIEDASLTSNICTRFANTTKGVRITGVYSPNLEKGKWVRYVFPAISVSSDWVGDDVYLCLQSVGNSSQYTNIPIYAKNIMVTYNNNTDVYEPYTGCVAVPNPGQVIITPASAVTDIMFDVGNEYTDNGENTYFLCSNNEFVLPEQGKTYRVWVDQERFKMNFSKDNNMYGSIEIGNSKEQILNGSDANGIASIVLAEIYEQSEDYVFNTIEVSSNFYVGVGNRNTLLSSAKWDSYWDNLYYIGVNIQPEPYEETRVEIPAVVKPIHNAGELLPPTYQRVEYIEGTGTQFIDTGVLGKNSLSFYAKTNYANNTLFGAQDGADANKCIAVAGSVNYEYIRYFASTGTQINVDLSQYDYYELEVSKSKATVHYDGSSTSITFSAADNTVDYPIYLFARNIDGQASGFSNRKIYSFKIWDDNALIRDYIPCINKYNNEAGLYDIVENKFYANQGTGKFIAGLPFEYQRVEYIESAGTQYIDTGVLASENNSFEVKAQLIHTNTTSQTLWGGRQSATAGALQSNQLSFVKSNGRYQFACGNVAKATAYSNTDLHIFKAERNLLYIDNELIYTAESAPITTQNSIYLFATNTAGTAGFNGGALRIYYCKIWSGEVLVRDYIPCYRKSDNVVGLYDMVNRVFYTNNGTGEFVKGANVTNIINVTNEFKCVLKGKNLIDVDKFVELLKTYHSASIEVEVDGRRCIKFPNNYMYGKNFTSCCPPFKENTRYIFSFEARPNTVMPESNQYNGNLSIGFKPRSVSAGMSLSAKTTTEFTRMYAISYANKTVTDISMSYGSAWTWLIDLDTIYLYEYEGDNNPKYEPYFYETIQIPSFVNVNGTDVSLDFASVYAPDKLTVDKSNNKVTYTKNNKFYTFTGDESLHRYAGYEYKGNIVMSCNVSGAIRSKINIVEGLCNKFKGDTPNNFVNMNRPYRFTTNANQLWFSFPKELIGATDETTTTEMYQLFRDWIKAQNEKGDYIYSCFGINPIEYNITDTELGKQLLNMTTQNGTNIIEIVGGSDKTTPTLTIKHLTHS